MRDESIHPGVIEVPRYEARRLQFFRAKQGVERGVNLDAKLMSVVAKPLNVLDGIARSSPCSEAWSPDIDCICTMIYGSDAALQVAGRGEEFEEPRPYQTSP